MVNEACHTRGEESQESREQQGGRGRRQRGRACEASMKGEAA